MVGKLWRAVGKSSHGMFKFNARIFLERMWKAKKISITMATQQDLNMINF
jgi:hypothetical protein